MPCMIRHTPIHMREPLGGREPAIISRYHCCQCQKRSVVAPVGQEMQRMVAKMMSISSFPSAKTCWFEYWIILQVYVQTALRPSASAMNPVQSGTSHKLLPRQ